MVRNRTIIDVKWSDISFKVVLKMTVVQIEWINKYVSIHFTINKSSHIYLVVSSTNSYSKEILARLQFERELKRIYLFWVISPFCRHMKIVRSHPATVTLRTHKLTHTLSLIALSLSLSLMQFPRRSSQPKHARTQQQMHTEKLLFFKCESFVGPTLESS